MTSRNLFWKQKEDEASDKKDEKNEEDEKKHPEIWWIYDGSGIVLAILL